MGSLIMQRKWVCWAGYVASVKQWRGQLGVSDRRSGSLGANPCCIRSVLLGWMAPRVLTSSVSWCFMEVSSSVGVRGNGCLRPRLGIPVINQTSGLQLMASLSSVFPHHGQRVVGGVDVPPGGSVAEGCVHLTPDGQSGGGKVQYVSEFVQVPSPVAVVRDIF